MIKSFSKVHIFFCLFVLCIVDILLIFVPVIANVMYYQLWLTGFLTRLEKCRAEIDDLIEEVKSECAKFSQDIKFWAEFQTGVKEFEPWVKVAEQKKNKGLAKPTTLAEACQILEESKVSPSSSPKLLYILHTASNFTMKVFPF